MKEYDQETSV